MCDVYLYMWYINIYVHIYIYDFIIYIQGSNLIRCNATLPMPFDAETWFHTHSGPASSSSESYGSTLQDPARVGVFDWSIRNSAGSPNIEPIKYMV